MSLQSASRVSFYLTMALACTCLAIGELAFLSWIAEGLAIPLALVFLAYRAEGKWSLGLRAANLLGLAIAGMAAGWILYVLPHDEQAVATAGLPWPAGMLPHLGPLLIALLLVKLFQPKTARGFWVLHALALLMVSLGCILADDTWFGIVLAGFIVSAVWSIALHHLEQQQVIGSRDRRTVSLFLLNWEDRKLPWRWGGLGQAARWSLTILLLGFAFFLAAPRQSNATWQPETLSKGYYELGIGIENSINLARVGTVEMDDEIAFEVSASTKYRPVNDLSPSTRWFAGFLEFYDHGEWLDWHRALARRKWKNYSVDFLPKHSRLDGFDRSERPRGIPDDKIYLKFNVPYGLAATKPLMYPPGQDTDAGLNAFIDETAAGPFFQRLRGSDIIGSVGIQWSPGVWRMPTRPPVFLGPGVLITEESHFSYGQLVSPGMKGVFIPAQDMNENHAAEILAQPLPGPIIPWVRDLLPQLPGLDAHAVQLDTRGHLPMEHHARVAAAMCEYLASSGKYSYSLKLRRHDRSEDPTADFLLNVKKGHCTRFASGLALMLRAVGIPSRVVTGFRGLERTSDGHYVVRMKHGHSWVQALVKVSDSNGWHWQTLDPTPGFQTSRTDLADPLSWFGEEGIDLLRLWRKYVLGVNAQSQGRAAQAIMQTAGSPATWLVLATLSTGAFGMYRLRRAIGKHHSNGDRSGAADPHSKLDLAWYERFLDVLRSRLNLCPLSGQTPLEFSRLVASRLAEFGASAAVCEMPAQMVTLLYSFRYGGRGLTPEQVSAAANAVASLEAALPTTPSPA